MTTRIPIKDVKPGMRMTDGSVILDVRTNHNWIEFQTQKHGEYWLHRYDDRGYISILNLSEYERLIYAHGR